MNAYQEAVLEARKKFLKLNLKQEEELLSIYEEAGNQVMGRLSKAKEGSLNQRYLRELNRAIKEYVSQLRIKLGKSIKDGMMASAEIAANAQAAYFDAMGLSQDLNSSFRKMFSQLPIDVVKTLISGNYYSDGKTLDQRIWELTSKNAKDIDRLIKVNVAQMRDVREVAKQLDAYVNPNSKTKAKTKIPGINSNVSYQAQRLARTSLDHANTETYIQGSGKNPFCVGLKWNLSNSHYERQVKRWGPDICDTYAGKVFKPKEYPVSHPNCLCYPTQEVEDTDKARDELIRWVKGEDNPKLDKWLDEYGEEFGIEGSYAEKFNTFSQLAVSREEKSGIIKERNINIYPNEQLPSKHSLSNKEARIWYLKHEELISDLININLSLEEKARLAYEIRNEYRTKARELMEDRKLAEELILNEKNKTFDELVKKYSDKGLTGDEIWNEIIASSMRSRKSVNKSLGLE